MNNEFVEILAKALSEKVLIASWNYLFWFLLLNLILSFGAAYCASYFAKKGENRANSEDLGTIKESLSVTTKLSEQIKAAVFDKLGRAEKLERYIVAVLDSETYYWKRVVNEVKNGDPFSLEASPLQTATMICSLYFPELEEVHAKLKEVTSKLDEKLNACSLKIQAGELCIQSDADECQNFMKSYALQRGEILSEATNLAKIIHAEIHNDQPD